MKCPRCNGKKGLIVHYGKCETGVEPCLYCGGRGEVSEDDQDLDLYDDIEEDEDDN